MIDVRCPKCGKSNPSELENCQFCGALLKPLSASTPVTSQSIKVGESPVRKDTAEFEKVKPAQGDVVHAGEAPTKKDTAALEPTLPSWLRSLREGQNSAESKSVADVSSNQNLPFVPTPASSSDSSGNVTDWLSGLDNATSEEEEEVPDWLASLRGDKAGASTSTSKPMPEPTLETTGSLAAGPGGADWMARLGGESTPTASEVAPQDKLQGDGESLDWLDSLKTEPVTPAAPEGPVTPQDNEELPDWLDALESKPVTPATVEGPVTPQGNDELPNWLNQLSEKSIDSVPASRTEEVEARGPDAPDWLTSFGSAPGTPEATTGESIPEWLSNPEAKTDSDSTSVAPVVNNEIPPLSTARDETPGWLAQFQADANAADEQAVNNEQFEAAPPSPEWQTGINRSVTSSGETPALIASEEGAVPGENAAFSIEMPDWLAKLKPEQAAEEAPEGDAETPVPEDLDVSELPSWVQAMRPVESVVAETKAFSPEDTQITEQSGPLAGLHGVLPVGPGLGELRKPPAYATILKVTEGQQHYAAVFEQMVSSETQPRSTKRTRLASNRLWRWLISGLLFLAIGLPLMTGIQVTQPSKLQPPEMVNAFTSIGSLPTNAPVLVVFDYDPALSGELEAAAAPLIDHLLLRDPRLALISTIPIGPVLAERLLHDSSTLPSVAGHNYQSGQQYVNLGYLAGGPAGVLYFAISPLEAAPFASDGQPAWQLPPLQGIQKLGDFDAIIVLTDDADNGRVWIEQTGSTISSTLMVMVISAQAEPLILPYYDSGQLKGLVTGLAGGEAYGQTFIRPGAQTGPAQRYWNSFSAGTLVAVLLILGGAVWSAIIAWRARRDKPGEGA